MQPGRKRSTAGEARHRVRPGEDRDRGAGVHPLLPSPGVRFDASVPSRVGLAVARIGAARQRREGAGAGRLFGVGSEFIGFRPYSAGGDLRLLDWSVYARTHKPFVRVTQREASEEWALLLDTSASMGVGQPGKLQLAAEFAAAVTALAQRGRATVQLITSGGEALRVRPRDSIAPVFAFLEGLVARGRDPWPPPALRARRLGNAGRVLVVGDLFGLEAAELLTLRRPGRELQVVQILAPEELAPRVGDSVEWVDPETDEHLSLPPERALVEAFDEELAALLEHWGQQMARHRIAYGVWSSERPFEDLLERGLF